MCAVVINIKWYCIGRLNYIHFGNVPEYMYKSVIKNLEPKFTFRFRKVTYSLKKYIIICFSVGFYRQLLRKSLKKETINNFKYPHISLITLVIIYFCLFRYLTMQAIYYLSRSEKYLNIYHENIHVYANFHSVVYTVYTVWNQLIFLVKNLPRRTFTIIFYLIEEEIFPYTAHMYYICILIHNIS